MSLPLHSTGRRHVIFALVLLLVLVLLVFTGLGVFRLYFDFQWHPQGDTVGELFSLKIRGGNSFNLFDAGRFDALFWWSLGILAMLALALPWLRLLPGAGLAGLVALALLLLHYRYAGASPFVPVEFKLLSVLVLFGLYVLMSLIGEIRDRQRFASLLSQYVPPELASAYSRNPERMGLSGEQREISVLFCDVVDFSTTSEALQPEQVADWLNGFFSLVSRVVVRHRGTIDKYMGDSVMAVWGAPAPSATHAFDALSAALDIAEELPALDRRYREQGLPGIAAGIGVSTGQAHVGNLGSEYRMDYTVVGDAVNIAQRLEAQTRMYRVAVIVGDRTAAALDDMAFRELDTIQVKGRRAPVTMYQPIGPEASLDENTRAMLGLHAQAMAASKAGRWEEAQALFSQLRNEWDADAPIYDLYLRGIAQARS